MHQGPGHLVKTGLRVGLSTGVVCALISASDADPGRGISENFPFSHVGAAILCNWTDDDCGFGRVSWVNDPDDSENFQATVGSEDARNVLRFRESPVLDERLATTAAQAARNCLRDCALTLSDIDVARERVIVAEDEKMHTASLAAALQHPLTPRHEIRWRWSS